MVNLKSAPGTPLWHVTSGQSSNPSSSNSWGICGKMAMEMVHETDNMPLWGIWEISLVTEWLSSESEKLQTKIRLWENSIAFRFTNSWAWAISTAAWDRIQCVKRWVVHLAWNSDGGCFVMVQSSGSLGNDWTCPINGSTNSIEVSSYEKQRSCSLARNLPIWQVTREASTSHRMSPDPNWCWTLAETFCSSWMLPSTGYPNAPIFKA